MFEADFHRHRLLAQAVVAAPCFRIAFSVSNTKADQLLVVVPVANSIRLAVDRESGDAAARCWIYAE
jgi:hypothetical protein